MVRSLGLLLAVPLVALPGQAVPIAKATVEWRLEPAKADLTGVNGILVAPNGELDVVHRVDAGIRFFGTNGERGVIGRRGEGPGDFLSLTSAGWRGDSLWIVDGRRRISFFDSKHKYLGSVPLTEVIHSGLTQVTARLPDGSLRVSQKFPQPRGDEWATASTALATLKLRVGMDGRVLDTIARLRRSACEWPFQAGIARGFHDLPFCSDQVTSDEGVFSSPLLAWYRDAEVRGAQGTFLVSLLDSRGKRLFERKIDYTPVPLPRALLDERYKRFEKAGPAQGYPEGYAKALVNHPVPTSYPPAKAIFVGRDSSVWIEMDQGPVAEHRWKVLRRDGSVDFEVVFPANIKVMTAERGRAWAVESDADDLQGLVRYRIVR
jgi:hypothetical protein